MARYLFRSLLLIVVLNLLVKPVWIFGIDREVQVLAGYEAYGRYFSYLNLAVIFNILADAGLTIFIQQHLSSQQHINLGWFKKAVSFKLLLSLAYTIIVCAVASLLGLTDHSLLLLMIALQLLLSWLSFFRAVISARQQFVVSSWLSVSDKLLLIVPGLVVLYVLMPGAPVPIHSFAFWQVVASAVSVTIALMFVWKYTSDAVVGEAGKIRFREMAAESAPMTAIVFIMFLHARADSVLLTQLPGTSEVQAGIYASMFRFVDMATVLSYLISGFLLSFWAKHMKQDDVIKDTTDKIFRMMMAGALLVSIVFFFYSKDLQLWFYQSANHDAEQVLKWGMLVLIPYFLVDLFGTLLTAARKLRFFLLLIVICAVLNITLNLIFIPVYQAMASAVIAIGTQGLLAAGLAYSCYRNWKLLPQGTSLYRLILLTLLLTVLILILQQTAIPVWGQLMIVSFVWMGLMFVLKLFSLNWIMEWQREN